MQPTQHRRRKYLINKAFQLRYAALIFITVALVAIASSACISFGVWHMAMQEFSKESLRHRIEMASRMSEYERARTNDETTAQGSLSDFHDVELLSIREKEILFSMIKDNNIDLAAKAFLLFVFIALGTIFLTHKIVGPHFRFLQTFKEIRNGNVKLRVHLRKNDHVQELVPHLNSMLGSLDYSFSKLKVLQARINEELKKNGVSSETITHYQHEIDSELNRYTTSNAYKIS